MTDDAWQDPTLPPSPDPGRVDVWIGLTLGLHVLAFAAVTVVNLLFLPSVTIDGIPIISLGFLLLIGLAQLIYIVPAVLIAFRRGRANAAKGLLIGASATILFNGVCWGVVNPSGLGHLLQQLFASIFH